jgi:hypothetical protein
MPSLILLSSTGGRSLCGTRQNRFKSKGFNDWVHQLLSFLKEILSYIHNHWQLTKPALGKLKYSSRINVCLLKVSRGSIGWGKSVT